MIEVPLPYADPELSAEVTPGVLTPVYPAHTEYPPDSQPNPQYPPEVYTPPDVYTHEQVFFYSIHELVANLIQLEYNAIFVSCNTHSFVAIGKNDTR